MVKIVWTALTPGYSRMQKFVNIFHKNDHVYNVHFEEHRTKTYRSTYVKMTM